MIADGAEIRLDLAEEVWVLGTPPELERFRTEFDPESARPEAP